RRGNGLVKIIDIKVYGDARSELPSVGSNLTIEFIFENPQKLDLSQISFDFTIKDMWENNLGWFSNSITPIKKVIDSDKIIFRVERIDLNEGTYTISTYISFKNTIVDFVDNILEFEIVGGDYYGNGKSVLRK